MKKHSLNVAKRTVFGRKVKNLRNEGKVPATVYGKKVKSLSIECELKAFEEVLKDAGETGVVELTVKNGKAADKRPVLVHTVQRHPVTDAILHVEFRQVDLKEKVEASVPLVHTGECPAVEKKTGVLLTLIDSVDVEALPTDLPENIEVDISALSEEGQEIAVKDLKTPKDVTILTDEESIVVRIAPLVMKETEELEEADAAEAAEAAEEAAEEATEEEKKEDDKEEKKEDAEAKEKADEKSDEKKEDKPKE